MLKLNIGVIVFLVKVINGTAINLLNKEKGVEGRVGKRELHPQASHRTVLDSLPSYGSCYSLIT